MPAWLLGAFQGVRSILFGTRLRAGVTGVSAGLAATPDVLPSLLGGTLGGGGLGLLGGDGGPRRRRRRRALTNSDRDDIAFIAATIGKTSAGSFAVQLVTRSR